MLRQLSLGALLAYVLLSSCDTQPYVKAPRVGPWHVTLHLGEVDLPFSFHLEQLADSSLRIHVRNGDEVILVDDIDRTGDSLVVRMPLYDSEFKGVTNNDGLVTGRWFNYLKGRDYSIPFTATAGQQPRFRSNAAAHADLNGQWRVHFSPGTPDEWPAVGLFEQAADGHATGTFLTELGDYRYLEGQVIGDSLFLSCFDGSVAYLFTAAHRNDSLIGRFWSGSHWQTGWVAVRDEAFTLSDPDSLTFLREGHSMVDFNFPDLEGNPVSPTDERFRGHTLVVQVMGSWCPNCVDETRMLNEFHRRYQERGLEVISLAFERYEDTARAVEALRRFRDVMEIRYPILYAGRSDKKEAASKLPFLNHVLSFPTTIIIDHTGQVRRIRTGMYGPGTGVHHERFKRSFEQFIESLLKEAMEA